MHDEKFIIPQTLTIAQNDKQNLLDFYNTELIAKMASRSVITVFQVPFAIHDTVNQTNEFLLKYSCKIGHYGIFLTPANLTDLTIHIDGCKTPTRDLAVLEARFSYYDLVGKNGEVEWFQDIGDRYEEVIVKEDRSARSYRFRWVENYKQGLIQKNDCPPSLFKMKTNIDSAIIRTNIPHRVIQGNELRATLGFQILDLKTGEPDGVWERFINDR